MEAVSGGSFVLSWRGVRPRWLDLFARDTSRLFTWGFFFLLPIDIYLSLLTGYGWVSYASMTETENVRYEYDNLNLGALGQSVELSINITMHFLSTISSLGRKKFIVEARIGSEPRLSRVGPIKCADLDLLCDKGKSDKMQDQDKDS